LGKVKSLLGVTRFNNKLDRANNDITKALGILSSPTPSQTPILPTTNRPEIKSSSKNLSSTNLIKVTELVDSAYKILTGTKTDLGISRQTCYFLQNFAEEYGIKLTASKASINYGDNTGKYRLNDALNKIKQANELCPNDHLKSARILLSSGLDAPVHTYYY
jgi:hypothetical protein